MRRLATGLLLMFLLTGGTARAQFFTTMGGASGAPATYTGPGDIVSGASGWWGLRAYNAAYATGSNAGITIRRASDNSTQVLNILSNGNLDTATATTFCASTTCFVTTGTDQTGNARDVTQATAANQPQLLLSGCPGNNPCMKFSGSQWLAKTSFVNNSQPNFVSFVAETTTHVNFGGYVVGYNGSSGNNIDDGSNTNLVRQWCGGGSDFTKTANDNVFHAFATSFSGTGGYLMIDGSNNTGTSSSCTATYGGVVTLGATNNSATQELNGYIDEAGVWGGSSVSSTTAGTLCHNQRTYWGTTGSC